MTNTVKMPRQHNRRLREVKRQRDYLEDLKEAALTIGAMFFFLMCLWGATEFYDWVCKLYAENQTLKVELREEKAAFRTMFVQEVEKKKLEDKEREQAVLDLCKRDERGCRIMQVTWKGKL